MDYDVAVIGNDEAAFEMLCLSAASKATNGRDAAGIPAFRVAGRPGPAEADFQSSGRPNGSAPSHVRARGNP